MTINKQVFQGVLWSIIQNWGSQAGSFIVFLILARLLTPQDFGLLSLANIFLAFMNIFLEQGFTSALIQRKKLDSEHLDTAFCTQVITGIFLTFISFFLAKNIALFFNQPRLTVIIQCFSFLFIINSFGHIFQAVLQRDLNFKILAVRSLIAIIISGFLAIIFALLGFGVWSLVIQQFTYESGIVIVMWNAIDWRPKLKFSYAHFQDLFNFSIYIFFTQFLMFFYIKSDNLLIGYFLGEIALGYYAIAYRILEVMTQLLIGVINQVAFPTFSKIQTDITLLRQTFLQAIQFTSLIAFPAFFGLLALTPEIIITLFGKQWTPSILVLRILIFSGILSSFFSCMGAVFLTLGKSYLQFYLTLLTIILSVTLACFLIKWGITAVAFAFVFSSYLIFPFALWMLTKLISITLKQYLQQFITPLISSVIMILAIVLVKYFFAMYLNTIILLIICIIVASLTYIISILQIKAISSKQN
ncbi:lipopolysaccharide biosynthesis protein [Geminocystis sp. GBBB08]|uniref:lipopolysaccharide biosynthesis protein n=1 Tax=Geminocystis sp. GBBB08 TaxID=2604140 RepID=UPI0027E3339F|nr:lipopolysaccharide biosynthesis protein [Geminocystis sp. GBBB08]MBL1210226.1 lipopolysaccharide biosynthesis protein [Geminocystis sp. GBBB08]